MKEKQAMNKYKIRLRQMLIYNSVTVYGRTEEEAERKIYNMQKEGWLMPTSEEIIADIDKEGMP